MKEYYYWPVMHPWWFFGGATLLIVCGIYAVYRIGLSIIEDEFEDDSYSN